MIKVGLTGGIGSGKSIITKVFFCLGIPVFNADNIAKEIVHNDDEVKARIKTLLGEEAFSNGIYNRNYVASKVFQDKKLLTELNHIIHPATIKAFEKWLTFQNAPYIIKEAAILFESGSHKSLDKTITVQAPEDLRIQRVLKRDKSNESQIRSRILSQLTDEQRANVADYVIINDDIEPVIPQILNLHKLLSEES